MGDGSVDFSVRSKKDIGVRSVILDDVIDVAQHLFGHRSGKYFIGSRVIGVAPPKVFAAATGRYILAGAIGHAVRIVVTGVGTL